VSPGNELPRAAEVVERALAASTSDGCVVLVEDGSEVDARFANNTTTTNGLRRQRRVVVVSMRHGPEGTSVGVASRSGAPDVAELVAASEADARGAPVAEDASPLVEPGASGSDDTFESAASETDFSILAPVLDDLGAAFDKAAAAGHVLAGFASHRVETLYLGSSTGIRRRHVQPTGSMELVGRAPDGPRSTWVAQGTPDFADVDLEAMHVRVEQRLEWARRRVELGPGRYETILPPDAVADLVIPLWEAMSGRDAEDGRNAFSAPGGGTVVGRRLSPVDFELRSDPAEPRLECRPFVAAGASGTDVSVFDDGLPLGRTTWLEGGAVQRLRYHRAGARRSGTEPAPAVDNLTLEAPGAGQSLDDLVAATERGLLLTCLWYIREVDPVTLLLTGLTRDGVFLVERGEVVGAVNNFRFNESPVDLLGRVVDAGRSERALSREWNEWMNRTAMPALRVADFNMSSVSPAT